jgi:hypothetical protein
MSILTGLLKKRKKKKKKEIDKEVLQMWESVK